ncbi:hypothetical protein C8Q74DRAFT_486746 [Fomes fomentarius]|nr:hypothetical protein C8Q74DRAFT_486746 [Fomes fomentarius]
MRLPSEFLLYVLVYVLGRASYVRANTEIVNFAVLSGPNVPIPQSEAWTDLTPDNTERLIKVLPAPIGTPVNKVCASATSRPIELNGCQHETWLTLDLDDPRWARYSKFTLRVSWPASHPAEFHIRTYTPQSLARLIQPGGRHQKLPVAEPATTTTRRMFARIRLVDTGVQTESDAIVPSTTTAPVPFIVTLEPLVLGVLPASLLPTIAVIVLVAVVAGFFVVPPVYRYLANLADEVRKETATAKSRKNE